MRGLIKKLGRGILGRQGEAYHPLLRTTLWLYLISLVIFNGNNSISVETNQVVSPAQVYRNFLANPPWLKEIKFSMDRNYEVDLTDEQHPRREEGLGSYQAALQPSGYYRKHLDGSPLYDNPPGTIPPTRSITNGQETVSGASDKYYWRLWEGQDSISLVPKDGQIGASSDNWLRGFFNFELADLDKIRRLGLDHLADAKITWSDNDHFTAVSPTQGTAHGSIASYTNGLPQTVEYAFDSASSKLFEVLYTYAAGRSFPPYQITIHDYDSDGSRIQHVNFIDELQMGLDPNAKAGYSPEAFRLRKESFSHVSISSNGVLYQVDLHGQLSELDTHYAPLKTPVEIKPHPLATALVLTTPTMAFVVYFLVIRRRQTKTDTTIDT